MTRAFVDRVNELEFLERLYREPRCNVVFLVGRRGVGKTELIVRFLREKPYVYMVCDLTSSSANLVKLSCMMAEFFDDPGFCDISFKDWIDVFVEFLEWKGDEKVVVVFDDFENLLQVDSRILSTFARLYRDYLSKRNDLMLVFCVSCHEGGLEKAFGGAYTLRVGELGFRDVWKFLSGYSFGEVIYVWSCVGGVPRYLKLFDTSLSFYDNVMRLFLVREGLLYREGDYLLFRYFCDVRNFILVLEALSMGFCRIVDIANFCGLDKALVSRCVDRLVELGLVGFDYRVLEGSPRRRFYFIRDWFLRFWFRFVLPYRDLIEVGEGDRVLEVIRVGIDDFVEFAFNFLVRDFIRSPGVLPFRVAKVGSYWWHTSSGERLSVDFVAFDEELENFVVGDVFWRVLNEKETRHKIWDLEDRIERSKLRKRNHYLCIVAREIRGKDRLRDDYPDVLFFDYVDFKKFYLG